MNELENLPSLLADIESQSYVDFELYCCVNQPDAWWDDPLKLHICENNMDSLRFLSENSSFKIIDAASKGHGWKGKNYGVGWARKMVMDDCAAKADPGDIILSLDGDTHIPPGYFASIAENLGTHPTATALSVPYYHPLTEDEQANRAILRYEIYMRYYALNLWRIGCPYSFTALGSALAVPVWAYKRIGGMTPNKSGEDFYFLQKLRKYGELLFWNAEKVYPAARYSDRVFFGTGPAMIKGISGDWSSYPLYDLAEFDLVKHTYQLFPQLFEVSMPTPMDDFLLSTFKEKDLWQPLRDNNPRIARFFHACHEKIDGLRILQFLKSRHKAGQDTDEENLRTFLRTFYAESGRNLSFPMQKMRFDEASVLELNQLRDFLCQAEDDFQKQHYLRQSI